MSSARPTSRTDRLRLHRPERDDLGDVLAAVLPRDVVDDLAAPPLAEVDVDVGHRDALGVEEALEDQVEVDRIDVGDAHAPRDERRGRRAAAGPDRDVLLASVADEVPDNQQVTCEPHLLDHLELVLETTLVLVDRVTEAAVGRQLPEARQPLRKALACHVLEVLVEREAVRDAKRRQMVLALRDRDVAALGNAQRVRERLGEVLEDRRHLFGRLEEELVAGITQTLSVVDRLAGTDAEEDVVRLGVPLPQVVDVVGRDERQPEVAGERDDAAIDDFLFLDALVLHLEEEVVLAQDVAQPARGFERRPRLLDLEGARHLAFQAAAEPDQACRMPCQQVLVDARAVVEPFRVTSRHQLDQVLVAFVRLGEQHEMIRLGLRPALVEPAALGDVDLAAQDGLQPALPRVIVKDDRGEHVAVLGHGQRRHLQLHRFVEQFVDPAGAVEQ